MNIEQRLLGFVQRNYLPIFVTVVAAAVAGLLTAGFRVENSIESWVDQSDEKYQDYRALVDTFGDDASIHVVFEREALSSEKVPAYLDFLDEIRGDPAVRLVLDPVELLMINAEGTGLDPVSIVDLKQSMPDRVGDYRNVLVSPDTQTLGVLILLHRDQQERHPEVLARVRKGMGDLGVEHRLAGTAYVSQTIADALTRDITMVVSGLMTISILVMLFYVRNVFVVVSVFAGIVISVIFCLAFATLLGVKLNLLSLVLFPLVFCVGLTTAIHLFSRTVEGKWEFAHAWLRVIRPASLAMLTTAIGSTAFAFAPQRVVRDMGLVIPFGVVVTFLLIMFFVPAVYRVLARKWTYTPPASSGALTLPRSLRGPVSILLLLLATASALLAPRISTEPDAIFFFPEDSELVSGYRHIEQSLTGLLVVEMMVQATDDRSVTGTAHLDQLQAFIDQASDLPGLTTVVTPLPWLQYGLAPWVPEGVRQGFLNEEANSLRLSFRFRNISDIPYAQSAAELQARWEAADTAGLSMRMTGLVPLILEAQDALLRTQAVIFPVILLIMTVILLLVMRSVRVLPVAVLANFVPLLVVLGVMALFGIPLNSINLFVASIMIGVIVDDTIHLLHAWRTEGDMESALEEVRPALWTTSATMVLAFSSLFLSGLAPIAQFGVLSVVALSVAYACDVQLLPWLMSTRSDRR